MTSTPIARCVNGDSTEELSFEVDSEGSGEPDIGDDSSEVLPNGCPADFNIHQLLPHENDCSKFYYCVYGETVICDWPHNVDCANAGNGSNEDNDHDEDKRATTVNSEESDILDNGCPVDFDVHQSLPHENDCSKYYYCVHGNKVCDRPEDAGCVIGGGGNNSGEGDNDNSEETEEPNNSVSGEDNNSGEDSAISGEYGSGDDSESNEVEVELLPNGCPADFNIHQLLPHDTDCAKFYYCICDWPHNAGCANAGSGEGNGSGENGNSGEDNGSGENGNSGEDDNNSGDGGNENGVLDNGCPADFNVHQLLPHESDCAKFYYCVHGEKVQRECGPGTHFNPVEQICDWPHNAGCANGGSGEDSGNSNEGGASGEGDNTEEVDNGNSGEGENTEEVDNGNSGENNNVSSAESNEVEVELLPNGCPADFDIHQLLPHESDCTKFYYCVHGEKQERECRDDLFFNPAIQVCDWPANVNCTNANSGESNNNSEEPISTEETESASSEDNDGILENGCPADFDVHLLLPHPYYCDRFFYCVNGAKVERECGPGTHFNPKLQVDPEGILPNGCPADFNIHQLLPHETDCAKFYYCVHGEKVERDCSEEANPNPGSEESNPNPGSEETNPNPGSEETNPNPGSEETNPNPGSESDETSVEAPEGSGSAENGSDENAVVPSDKCKSSCNIGAWAHEHDCDKFWRCDGDNAALGKLLLLTTLALTQGRHVEVELEGTKVASDLCPEEGHYLLPHEYDCTKFYYCESASTHLELTATCPPPTEPPTEAPEPTTEAPTETPAPITTPTEAPSTPAPITLPTEKPELELLPNGCPADFEEYLLLPHETQCNKFYYCLFGEKVERVCSPGTHFNPAILTLRAAVNLTSVTTPRKFSPTDAPLISTSTNCFLMRATAVNSTTAYTERLLRDSICDWPHNVDCANAGNGSNEDNDHDEDSESNNVNSEESDILDNGCPADFDVHQLLPHENDCSKYYYCVHGNKVCDRPEDAGCVIGGGENNSGEGDNDNSEETAEPNNSVSGEDNNSGEDSAISGEYGSGDDSESNEVEVALLPNGCPADFNIHQLLPHDTDCAKFYYCVHGEKVERECGPGTHFNPSLQICDWPHNAGCANAGSGEGNGSGENGNSGEDNGSGENGNSGEDDNNSGDGGNENGVLDNGCPADFNVHQLLPHESDCAKFYYCVHGEKVQRECGPGTHFNPVEQICDWPHNAGCANGGSGEDSGNSNEGGASGEGDNTEEVDNGNSGEGDNTEEVDNGNSGEGENTEEVDNGNSGENNNVSSAESNEVEVELLPNGCPADFDIHQLLPHESDCTKFYYCVHGEKQERECRDDLFFNPAIQVCDWPANVDCTNANSGESNNNSEEPISTEETESASSEDNDGILENGCPADFDVHKLLPHPYYCDRFFYCVNGAKVCDHPSNVNCVGGAGSVIPSSEESASSEVDPEGILPNGCPADFNIHQLLPHETDCAKFYYCVHGEKVERDCGPNTHFNPVCDHPENAGCANAGNSEETDPNPGSEEANPNPGSEEANPNPGSEEANPNPGSEEANPNPGSEETNPNPGSEEANPNPGSEETNPNPGSESDETSVEAPEGSGSAENGSDENAVVPSDKCKSSCNIGAWAHEHDCDKFWRCDGDNAVLDYKEGFEKSDSIVEIIRNHALINTK
ncbi:hypothetical protein MSG28_015198 [Choristoneura fumiferana]|uniref:Uncharacterized protein n=1 Tax=Choristoneura fumiferana TaxID=7141 RepID=A0ACC0KZ64_CHOFU|nr:hypothetical protein MSG28_015198 [Choristoneura fumiferana]